jgi:hypothetical protein
MKASWLIFGRQRLRSYVAVFALWNHGFLFSTGCLQIGLSKRLAVLLLSPFDHVGGGGAITVAGMQAPRGRSKGSQITAHRAANKDAPSLVHTPKVQSRLVNRETRP